MTPSRLALVLFSLSMFAQGCVQNAPRQIPTPLAPAPTTTSPTPATPVTTYEDYTPRAYEAARQAGQPIFLNFYASWCPYCREQEPRIVALYENGAWPAGIKAFRVHFNDSETNEDDKALAKTFSVGYQHTYIFIGRDGKEVKRTTGTTTDTAFLENLQGIAP